MDRRSLPHVAAIILLGVAAASALRAQASQDPRHEHGHEAGGRHDATAHHRFDDAQEWAHQFENPARDAWQHPDEIVAKLVSRDDLVIADIGSATGYFPVRFARAVPNGIVFGSDIEPSMVMYLNDRAREENLTNLTSVLASPDDPHLPRPVDLVFLCNTYHHIDDRVAYLRELKSQMTPHARVAVVDFRLDSTKGPPHKLDPDIVREEMQAAGYALDAEHDFLSEQYFLVYRALKIPMEQLDEDVEPPANDEAPAGSLGRND